MGTKVKICGLRDQSNLDVAVQSGAHMAGFAFFKKSPRYIDPDAAAQLIATIPATVKSVALFVNPGDDDLEQVLTRAMPDIIQLHGDEDVQRCRAIRDRFKRPVIKALGIKNSEDVALACYWAKSYKDPASRAIDYLLLDAKPLSPNARPGGNAICFDWTLLSAAKLEMPWLLAGGLTADNLDEALRLTHALAVDISSGVESSPGQKDPELIRAFLNAVAKYSPSQEA